VAAAQKFAAGTYFGPMNDIPEIHRLHHRAIALDGRADDAQRALASARDRLQRAVDDGRVLTASAFRYREHFFTYAECIGTPIAHEELFGEITECALWPDRRARFIPMMDIFHCGVPWTVDYWRRRAPIEKVEAHVIRIIPEKLASYIFYHYQLQEEQLGSFDKFAVIALNDNLLFYYKEHPFVVEPPLRPGMLQTKNTPDPWHPLMITHFQPWPEASGPEDYWRAIETLWTAG
jgi:hypothetical protein